MIPRRFPCKSPDISGRFAGFLHTLAELSRLGASVRLRWWERSSPSLRPNDEQSDRTTELQSLTAVCRT